MSLRILDLAWMALGAAIVVCLLSAPVLFAPQDAPPPEDAPAATAQAGGPYAEFLELICAPVTDRETSHP